MEYREFVAEYIRRHRPSSPAEARRLMREAAAAWRRGRHNPHELKEGFGLGLGAGFGAALALIGAGIVLALLSPDKRCSSC